MQKKRPRGPLLELASRRSLLNSEGSITSGKAAVSVLLTYYNEAELFTECLESIRAMSVQPHEILVYDDCSPKPASDYLLAGLNVRVIRGEINRGPSHGRNRLLEEASSDYIHWHDSDDLFAPAWGARVLAEIETHRPEAVFTEVLSFDESGVLSEAVLNLAKLETDPDLVRFCIRGAMLVPAGTYRRDCILSVGGYRESVWQSEDFDFHIRLAASGISYRILNEPLVRIRIRKASRSQNRKEVWYHAFKAAQTLATELPEKYHSDLGWAVSRFASSLYQLGEPEQAEEAFRFAASLGFHDYSQRGIVFNALANAFSPMAAEKVALRYRSLKGVLKK